MIIMVLHSENTAKKIYLWYNTNIVISTILWLHFFTFMYFYFIVKCILTVGFSKPIGSDVCNYSFFFYCYYCIIQ